MPLLKLHVYPRAVTPASFAITVAGNKVAHCSGLREAEVAASERMRALVRQGLSADSVAIWVTNGDGA